MHSGKPPVIHIPSQCDLTGSCKAQLRTQSPLINGGNDCDQSKVGMGERGPTAKWEEGEEEGDREIEAR